MRTSCHSSFRRLYTNLDSTLRLYNPAPRPVESCVVSTFLFSFKFLLHRLDDAPLGNSLANPMNHPHRVRIGVYHCAGTTVFRHRGHRLGNFTSQRHRETLSNSRAYKQTRRRCRELVHRWKRPEAARGPDERVCRKKKRRWWIPSYEARNVAFRLTNLWKTWIRLGLRSPGFYTPSDMLTARVSCDTDTWLDRSNSASGSNPSLASLADCLRCPLYWLSLDIGTLACWGQKHVIVKQDIYHSKLRENCW